MVGSIDDDDDLLLAAGDAAEPVRSASDALGPDDDSMVLEDLDESSVLSSSDSGVNLAPDDSGVNLEGASPSSFDMGSAVIDDSGLMSFEEGGSVPFGESSIQPTDDFLLTAAPGSEVDEESSSQVIALDEQGGGFDSGVNQLGGAFPAADLGGFGGPALMDQGSLDPGGYAAPAPSAMGQPTVIVSGPAEKPYSIFSVLGLLLTIGFMVPSALLMVDLISVLRGTGAEDQFLTTGLASMLWDSSKNILEPIFGS